MMKQTMLYAVQLCRPQNINKVFKLQKLFKKLNWIPFITRPKFSWKTPTLFSLVFAKQKLISKVKTT